MHLVENSRTSDSHIASQLGISSQAVGKTRRKLEGEFVDSYSTALMLDKVGVGIIALSVAKLTNEGKKIGERAVHQLIHESPHVISAYRVDNGDTSHVIVYAFKSKDEMEKFFYSEETRNHFHKYLETKDLFTCSENNLVKNSMKQLLLKNIDEMSTRSRYV